jgi:hypothetical protein
MFCWKIFHLDDSPNMGRNGCNARKSASILERRK